MLTDGFGFQLRLFLGPVLHFSSEGVNTKKDRLMRSYYALDGGPRRNRTDDLLNAIQALSQLSYGPIWYPQPDLNRCLRRERAVS